MRNEEKLYLAIGEIDERLIEEAAAPYEKQARPFKKAITIAASIAVMVIIINGVGSILTDMPKGDAAAPEDSNNMSGESSGGYDDENDSESTAPAPDDGSHGKFGELTLLYSEGYSYTFILNVYSPAGRDIDVYLYSVDGKSVYTNADNVSGKTVYRPIITVNGESAERLPGEIGEYTVTISFDGINQENIAAWKNHFIIDGFGPIYIDQSAN